MTKLKRILAAGAIALAAAISLGPVSFHFGTPAFAQVQKPNNVLNIGSDIGSTPSVSVIGLDTNIGLNIVPQGTGTVAIGGVKTDNWVWVPDTWCATDVPWSTAANLQPTGSGPNGTHALNRTAAGAETYNVTCHVPLTSFRTATSKGIRIDTLSFCYAIGVVALTNHDTIVMQTSTYANAANPTNASYGGTLSATSLSTAANANPYLTAITPGTPAFLNVAAQTNLFIRWRVIMANTGTYQFCGIGLTYSTAVY